MLYIDFAFSKLGHSLINSNKSKIVLDILYSSRLSNLSAATRMWLLKLKLILNKIRNLVSTLPSSILCDQEPYMTIDYHIRQQRYNNRTKQKTEQKQYKKFSLIEKCSIELY